jgi:hypothetical protein
MSRVQQAQMLKWSWLENAADLSDTGKPILWPFPISQLQLRNVGLEQEKCYFGGR